MRKLYNKKVIFFVLLNLLLIVTSSFYLPIKNVYAFDTAYGTEILNDEKIIEVRNSITERNENCVLISGNGTSMPTYSISEFSNVKYIPNANYFLINPKQHENLIEDNEAGTCTTVAMQMLLGYHNYYSDRRLIPTTFENYTFLSEDYGDLTFHPALKRTIMPTSGSGCEKIGTTDDVYHAIYDLTTWASFPSLGQNIYAIKDAAIEFVEKHSASISNNVSITASIYNADEVKHDLDSGLPVILCTQPVFTGAFGFHVVVAYGYAQLDGVNGYLVHFGWQDDATQVWVPESWIGFQTRMSVNHAHTYIDTGINLNNTHRELICSECGQITVDNLYEISNSKIESVKYPLIGAITIPSVIDVYSEETATFISETITEIGSSVFANQTQLTSIALSSTITNINECAFSGCVNLSSISTLNNLTKLGDFAFKNCSSLTSFYVPMNLADIGEGVFVGCNNLNLSVASNSANYSVLNNILYDKARTKIISSGKINSEVKIGERVTEISSYAFSENSNLQKVYFKNYTPPIVGVDVFLNTNLNIFVPYNSQEEYKTVLSQYANLIYSENFAIILKDGEIVVDRINTVYSGSNLSGLVDYDKKGYEFLGWYDENDVQYDNGDLVEGNETLILYAKTEAKQYTVTFNANGGSLTGDNTEFLVTYDSEFETQTTACREGYSFEGWIDTTGKKYLTKNGECVIKWDKDENSTLYADWTIESYVIKINDNGTCVWLGVNGLSDVETSIPYGTVIDCINLIATFRNSQNGYKEGKIFNHFEYETNELQWLSVPDLGESGSEIIIKPVWKLEENKIYFSSGCDIIVPEIKAEYDESIEIPEIEREGYTFIGWHTHNCNCEDYKNLIRMPDLTPNEQNNGSIQLYAHWEENQYKIVYDANTGVGAMDSSDWLLYSDDYVVLECEFTKIGHHFIGWALMADGVAIYNAGQNISKLLSTNGTVTFYAVWEANKYDIIYKNLLDTMQAVYPNSYTYGIGVDKLADVYIQGVHGVTVMTTFFGWYNSLNFTPSNRVTNISKTQTGTVIVYGYYEYRISSSINSSMDEEITEANQMNQYSYDFYIGLKSFYYEKLSETSMKKLRIKLKVNYDEINDGYQEFYIYKDNNILWSDTDVDCGDRIQTGVVYEKEIFIDVEICNNTDELILRFSANGFAADKWRITGIDVTVYLVDQNES